MSEAVDHFAAIPLRFTAALVAGEINPVDYAIGVYVATCCYEARNTAAGVATIRLSTPADLFNISVDTVERSLERLEAGRWIGLGRPGQGQRIGWRISLERLALDGEAEITSASLPHDFRTPSAPDPPSVRKWTSVDPPATTGAIPHGYAEETPAPLPHSESALPTNETKRKDTKRETENNLSEQNYDHLVGKTTAATLECERAFLAELHDVFVLNGGGRWVENDDEDERR